MQSPTARRPRWPRQHLEENILALARRLQPADARKSQLSVLSQRRPRRRSIKVDVKGIANQLCIEKLTADLFFRYPAICVRHKVATQGSSEGRPVALGQSVSGPPKILVAVDYDHKWQVISRT